MTPSNIAQARQRIENDKTMDSIAKACRDSFHSLIGDIWIAGIQTNFFSGKLSNDNPLPPMFLWDSNIPKPNRFNITAWYLTLEDPLILTSTWKTEIPVVRPPMSISPYHFNPSDTWNNIDVPVLFNSQPQGIRNNLQNSFTTEYKWQSNFSGGFSQHGIESQCTEIDFLAFLQEKQEELDLLATTKLSLLYYVLTPPGLSLTSGTSAYTGVQIRLWTTHGIWIKNISQDSQEERPKFASSQINLTKSGTKRLDFVPNGTPRVWFGFTNEHEAAEFMAVYFRYRHIAVETAQGIRPTSGVVNPEWESTMTKLGLLVDSDTEPTPNKTSRTKTKADALASALSGMNFDLL